MTRAVKSAAVAAGREAGEHAVADAGRRSLPPRLAGDDDLRRGSPSSAAIPPARR